MENSAFINCKVKLKRKEQKLLNIYFTPHLNFSFALVNYVLNTVALYIFTQLNFIYDKQK